MSIIIGSNSAVQTNTDTAVAVKTANLAKSQQALEGEMALKLIQSADINSTLASGNIGGQINIKV